MSATIETQPETTTSPGRPKKKRRLARVAVAICLFVLLGVGATYAYVTVKERGYIQYVETGKNILSFLQNYAKAIQDSHAAGNPESILGFYAEDYASPARGHWQLEHDGSEAGMTVEQLRRSDDADFDLDELAAEFRGQLASLTTVDRTKCKINLIHEVDEGKSATISVKYILDGTLPDGRSFQDRYFIKWDVENRGTGAEARWVIVKDALEGGVRVSSKKPSYIPADPVAAGIDFTHQRDPKLDPDAMKFTVIGHAMGGMNAVDYNDDHRPDLFFTDGVECKLYRNDTQAGELKFTDVTEEVGLDGIGEANAALFIDLDNDGDKDVFVVRYLAPCLVYINDDGFFEQRNKVFFEEELNEPCIAASALDYDLDGYMDIYLAVNGNAFETSPRIMFYAKNAEPNRLLKNVGGREFEDVTESSGTGDLGWSLASAVCDYTGNGYPDIAVANDFGRKTLYANNGDGTFREAAKEANVLDFSGGMGIAFADVNNDGWFDLYTSNINSNQRWLAQRESIGQYLRRALLEGLFFEDMGEYQELAGLVDSKWNEMAMMTGEGNSLFHNRKDGTFTEIKDSFASRAGWGWSVAIFDGDHDTDLDIYAANGWISADEGTDL